MNGNWSLSGGVCVAAVALAGALLITPGSSRQRLIPQRRRGSGRLPAVAAAIGGLAAALCISLTTGLALILAGGTLLLRYRRRVARRRTAEERRLLQAALEVLVGELNVGAHPVRAFAIAAEETGGVVGSAFRLVAARAGLGADVSAGLRAISARSTLAHEWNRLAVFWQLAAQHGLAISTLMRAAQLDIVERQRYYARLDAGMAGARATAVILAALPVLGVMLGEFIGAAPVAFLTGGGFGGALLVIGVALLCAGLWWADRITDRLTA
ncbi:type II secretion system F family protein [Mycolicibacterium komossense]|uniref:Type II secretion system F family protein n=1 Tax=Mycolicibacterium komossense TaxID=1779 RepID=A0ABT3CLY4_9MYCO|nr:type II secretion system F family protein [Mycolicibacterium komossense]MCV7230455.1 type II secretion system F family protein [Mycolicibacterium komossense]